MAEHSVANQFDAGSSRIASFGQANVLVDHERPSAWLYVKQRLVGQEVPVHRRPPHQAPPD